MAAVPGALVLAAAVRAMRAGHAGRAPATAPPHPRAMHDHLRRALPFAGLAFALAVPAAILAA